ncbi:hypothetical protein DENSPDRAFT_554696 [Dentipellis sp. KUC8613]|nr:hypothetical protein DENSPDRAFT_554696 [Dentipellis sp. KUC8613]
MQSLPAPAPAPAAPDPIGTVSPLRIVPKPSNPRPQDLEACSCNRTPSAVMRSGGARPAETASSTPDGTPPDDMPGRSTHRAKRQQCCAGVVAPSPSPPRQCMALRQTRPLTQATTRLSTQTQTPALTSSRRHTHKPSIIPQTKTQTQNPPRTP